MLENIAQLSSRISKLRGLYVTIPCPKRRHNHTAKSQELSDNVNDNSDPCIVERLSLLPQGHSAIGDLNDQERGCQELPRKCELCVGFKVCH